MAIAKLSELIVKRDFNYKLPGEREGILKKDYKQIVL